MFFLKLYVKPPYACEPRGFEYCSCYFEMVSFCMLFLRVCLGLVGAPANRIVSLNGIPGISIPTPTDVEHRDPNLISYEYI